jgi:hypothetical protein
MSGSYVHVCMRACVHFYDTACFYERLRECVSVCVCVCRHYINKLYMCSPFISSNYVDHLCRFVLVLHSVITGIAEEDGAF